jgi:outer membrane protein, multidrug efflux system
LRLKDELQYLSPFFSGSSGYYQIGPGISWRIFDAGRIRFQILAESARTDAAAVPYLNAFRDVETLVVYGNAQSRRDELAAESAADADATRIARIPYEKGPESFLPVLDAERARCAADDGLAQSERDSGLALIALYKSLGGGWQTRGTTTRRNGGTN